MLKGLKWKKYIPELTITLIVFFMVWLAIFVNDNEVIFPEIAAIATGALLAPSYTWRIDRKRIFILLLICGLCGMAIVRYVPFGLIGQMILASLLSQLIYLYSRTTFAPLVSAIVLPVLMQSRSVWYLISLVLFTCVILCASCLIEKYEIRPVNVYQKTTLPQREDLIAAWIRIAVMCVMITFGIRSGMRFMAAPPLLVAFTEFCKPDTHVSGKSIRFLFLLTGCATIGSAIRFLVTICLGLPLCIAAVIAIVLFIFVLHRTGIYLPPAGAMVLLAMLIPAETVMTFPLQVFAGAAVYLGVSSLYIKFLLRKKN